MNNQDLIKENELLKNEIQKLKEIIEDYNSSKKKIL